MSNEDTLKSLGHILDHDAPRDAVHIAVVPVIAGEYLVAGAHVGLDREGRASGAVEETIGVVDPYLECDVEEGQRFWLFLYPGSITSLHHHWTHPSFDTKEEDAPIQVAGMHEKYQEIYDADSEGWLRRFVEKSDCPDYDTVIQAALHHARGGHKWDSEYLHFDDMDAHGEIPDEFWDRLEKVERIKIPEHVRAKFFSCAC